MPSSAMRLAISPAMLLILPPSPTLYVLDDGWGSTAGTERPIEGFCGGKFFMMSESFFTLAFASVNVFGGGPASSCSCLDFCLFSRYFFKSSTFTNAPWVVRKVTLSRSFKTSFTSSRGSGIIRQCRPSSASYLSNILHHHRERVVVGIPRANRDRLIQVLMLVRTWRPPTVVGVHRHVENRCHMTSQVLRDVLALTEPNEVAQSNWGWMLALGLHNFTVSDVHVYTRRKQSCGRIRFRLFHRGRLLSDHLFCDNLICRLVLLVRHTSSYIGTLRWAWSDS